MTVPGVRATQNLQATLQRSRPGIVRHVQKRYAGSGGVQQPQRSQTVPVVAAGVAATIPLVWYFSSSTPSIPVPTHVTNSPADASRTQISGENAGDDAQNWARLPSSGIKRGKKHDNPMGQELGKGQEFIEDDDGNMRSTSATAKDSNRGPTSGEITGKQSGLSTGPTKHSLPIDQDKTRSKKSTGEPETAKAQDVIQVIPSNEDEEVEDIFASAPGLIFPDDTRNHHGDPGATIVYESPRFGDIELRTADPNVEDERQLFSHYLWNAGIKLANLIGRENDLEWSIEGQTVLELGAGTGLVGIVAALAKAEKVSISDYPAPIVLDNIRDNAKGAIPLLMEDKYEVVGHGWGELNTPFAEAYQHRFTRILAADCLWMDSQHSNLVNSMMHFLTLDDGGRIFVVAGFHTGRARIAAFFDVAVEAGLRVERIYEEDVASLTRPWMKERDGGREDVTGRKRWLVVARLKRWC